MATLDTRQYPSETSWKPTRKWVSNAVAGVASILGSWIVTGNFDDVERGMSATLLVGLATAYFVSNEQTITEDGVPEA